jgi:hypothetical protein
LGVGGPAAGREFLIRKNALTVNQDSEVSDKVGPAQITAIAAWGALVFLTIS